MPRPKSPHDPPTASFSVAVRVEPGAGRDRLGGRHEGPHGPALVVAVAAPAVDGRATDAVRRAPAAALGPHPGAAASAGSP